VIKQVVETTDLMTRVMAAPSKLAQALRDVVIPMVSRLAPFQHAFVQRLSELGSRTATQLCARIPDVVELRWGARQEITLVRPDGYTAFSAGVRDGLRAFDSVGSLLERQTHAAILRVPQCAAVVRWSSHQRKFWV